MDLGGAASAACGGLAVVSLYSGRRGVHDAAVKPLRGTSLKRFLKNLDRPPRDLVVVLADVEDPVNVGSAFRIADAAGVTELVLAGITPSPPHKLIEKVGRGKDSRVKWRKVDDVAVALAELRSRGYWRVAVELTEDAVPYLECTWPQKVCLVVGHEDHGVTQKALAQTDARVFIPMYGKGASLNVHVAMGIVVFQALHGPANAVAAAPAPAPPASSEP